MRIGRKQVLGDLFRRGSATGTADISLPGMAGRGLKHLPAAADFNDPAQIHDRDLMADAFDHSHVAWLMNRIEIPNSRCNSINRFSTCA